MSGSNWQLMMVLIGASLPGLLIAQLKLLFNCTACPLTGKRTPPVSHIRTTPAVRFCRRRELGSGAGRT